MQGTERPYYQAYSSFFRNVCGRATVCYYLPLFCSNSFHFHLVSIVISLLFNANFGELSINVDGDDEHKNKVFLSGQKQWKSLCTSIPVWRGWVDLICRPELI